MIHLRKGLAAILPEPVDPVLNRFAAYRELLLEWNRTMNLISRRDESRIEERHFLESIGLLSVDPFPAGSRVLDIGSGAGFPGLPIKLVRPDLLMTLVESKRKKGRFLQTVCDALELKGIDVVVDRIESVSGRIGPFEILISRSVSDLTTLVRWTRRCWKPDARLLVIKGISAEREAADLLRDFKRDTVVSVKVVRFDPFPEQAPREESFVVIVHLGPGGKRTEE